MSETSDMHELHLEWGCITNLMNKISDIEEKIDGGWLELIDMIADAVCEENEKNDPVSAFFNLYAFLWRLYYRLRTDASKRQFNIYSDQGEEYWVTNYSYKFFVWAQQKGFADKIDNLVIKVPKDKLTEQQKRAFSQRCQEGTK